MSSDWSLRLARVEDAPKLPPIEAAASFMFAEIEGLANLAGSETIPVKRLERYIRKGHCLIAHIDEAPVGFVANEPFGRELHIWELDVHPDHQRKQIGAGLLRACQIDARNAGFRALTLTTFRDVPWNAPFYARLGFVEIDDLATHARLSAELDAEEAHGLLRERRCAMICFLD